MKKTDFNKFTEKFKERIKTDKKFKTQFTTIMVASVVVVATAITVPAVIHNNKIKAKEDPSIPIVAEIETETVTIPDGVETTVDEQGNVVAVTNENGEYVYTTAVSQTEPETEAPKETSKRTLQSLLPTNRKAIKTTAQAIRIMAEIRETQEIQVIPLLRTRIQDRGLNKIR